MTGSWTRDLLIARPTPYEESVWDCRVWGGKEFKHIYSVFILYLFCNICSFSDRLGKDGDFSFALHAPPLVLMLLQSEPDPCVDQSRDFPAVFPLRQVRRILHVTWHSIACNELKQTDEHRGDQTISYIIIDSRNKIRAIYEREFYAGRSIRCAILRFKLFTAPR